MEKSIRLAVQKSGRLSEKSLEIIRSCGINFNSDGRVLKEKASNFPMEFLYIRDDDIPTYVKNGVADVGIVGLNEYDEQNLEGLKILRYLGFAKCRLSIAVPRNFPYKGLSSLEGKRIATSYPNILGKILKKEGVNAQLVYITGSVEITPAVDVADAICDIVSTGTTLKMNGIEAVQSIYSSEAVLIGREDWNDKEAQNIVDRLMMRFDAVMRAKNYKYVMFNLPEEKLEKVASLVGGMKSPTVTKLMEKGWIEQLRDLGAEGILVTAIEKMTE